MEYPDCGSQAKVTLPRIYHIITLLELGGAQQNTVYCTKMLNRSKYRVGLIAGRGGVLDPEAEALPEADVIFLPSLKHPISPIWDLVALFRLICLLRRKRVSLVHTHSSKAGILGRWAAFVARVPLRVHTIHGWSFHGYQPFLKRRLFLLLERLTGLVTHTFVAVAESDIRKGLEANIGNSTKYRLIHSGTNLEAFRSVRSQDPAQTRAELGLDPARPVVGMAACFKPQKAPVDFVEVAFRVGKRLPEAQFLLVGDGILRDRVEEKVTEYGLSGRFLLPGWRRDIPEIMNAMDVSVLTSLWEGLPRVVLQSLCCGTPVVATAVNGTVEVIEDGGNGFLVPPGDVDMAAQRIVELLEDPSLRERLSLGALKSINPDSDFDERGMLKKVEELYDQLLEMQQ